MVKKFLRSKLGATIIALIAVTIFAIPSYLTATAPFTYSDYDNLSIGMSVKEASKKLRDEGVQQYENKRNDGTVISSYTWTNPDGSFVQAKFENGKLKQKSERGLK